MTALPSDAGTPFSLGSMAKCWQLLALPSWTAFRQQYSPTLLFLSSSVCLLSWTSHTTLGCFLIFLIYCGCFLGPWVFTDPTLLSSLYDIKTTC